MSSVRRRLQETASTTDRSVYQWAIGVALAATLAFILLAIATLRDTLDGSPVSAIDAAWPFSVGTLLVAGLAGGLAQVVIQLARPNLPPPAPAEQMPFLEDQRRGSLAWVLPLLVTIAAVLLVRLYHTTLAAAIGAVVVLVATAGTVIAHYHLRDERLLLRQLADLSLLFLTSGTAFFLLTMIYSNKWRSLYSAVAIGLATTLMLLQRTDGIDIAWLRRLLYAVIGGLLMSQVTWALNYWAAFGLIGGALLLVIFYTIDNISKLAITATLRRSLVIEYLAVMALAFVAIAIVVTLQR
jgi:hypothetical protein